jgi:uncharacterized membrane protein YbhN (UPF0104 family)
MKSSYQVVLKRWGKPALVMAAFACLALTLRHSVKDIAHLPAPKLGWLALAVVLFLIHYLIQALGWHGILKALGQPAPVRLSLRMWYMSLIARWMPGRIWYSASRLYLAREAGISVTAVTFAIVLELIYILMGGLIATLLFAGTLLRGVLASSGGQSALIGIILLLFVCAGLVLRPSTLLWMCRFSLFRKAVRRLAGETLTEQNMPSLRTGRSLALLAYYTAFWVYSGVMFGVLAGAFVPMNPSRWLACIPAFAGSWMIGFFSIVTPAGLGAREGAMWLMLKPVMPQAQAIVLAVTSRLMMLATELLSVGLIYGLLRGEVRLPRRVVASDHEELGPIISEVA